MRPPVPRFVRWAVALAVMAALTLVVFQYWGNSQYGTAATRSGQIASQNPGWTPTRWGPLGAADRNLLVMIRQAGLSAVPSGRQAQRQGGTPQVRTVAKTIWVDCGDLDNQVRSVAGQLGVPLPDAPTAQQQAWMKELSSKTGSAYDRMFAQSVRLTDGAVLPAVTAVRAGTRNELIRSLATNAATVLNRHMDVLERTGLVDYSTLPIPSPAAPAAASGSGQRIEPVVNATPVVPAGSGNDANAMVAALVSIAGLLLALCLLGTGRRFRKPATAPQHHRPQQRRHAAHRW